ncbi:YoaK family protein [Myroides ceti]|uniref:YoaK family protein n=1 Tax=Paenimyroides ceti TaxID=395087 RepID=A0ABT8CZ77_9FLAO|nr:YoaK family protein [Paenimyroides ceti]MDN3709819.1 YoaK family protein [Paenimyroides ceti]
MDYVVLFWKLYFQYAHHSWKPLYWQIPVTRSALNTGNTVSAICGYLSAEFLWRIVTGNRISVGLLLFAMGLQNGLTASISNSAIKTTHLTGLTTDLAILLSMFTKKRYRRDVTLQKKAQLLGSIMFFYVAGGIITGLFYYSIHYYTFYVVCAVLGVIILYDYYKLSMMKYVYKRQLIVTNYYKKNKVKSKKEQQLKEALCPEK